MTKKFLCIRCKKLKPRSSFGNRFVKFGRDGEQCRLSRKLYCKSCDTGKENKLRISGPAKIFKKKNTREKICPICRETFYGGGKKYCSPICQNEITRRRRIEKYNRKKSEKITDSNI